MRIRQPFRIFPSPRSNASLTEVLIIAIVLAAVAASVPAQRQFDELGKRHLRTDEHPTQCAALGDVDGDGDLDIVFGNRGQNRLYLNDGTGTYTDATAARMPVDNDQTRAVALGDVDGDGDLDMVFGNSRFNWFGIQNRLYLNDGTGTFTDATAARMPTDKDRVNAMALGDVDGDGDLDIVFGIFGQNRLYLNNGSGTYTDATATRMPTDSGDPAAVALGDFDGDGDLDLVIGNSPICLMPPNCHGGQNRLYLNDGTGTFSVATAARMPTDKDDTRAVALGDVDGDGDLDMVFGGSGQNRLYRNDGSGKFTDATATHMPVDDDRTAAVALGDVDVDGDLDLVIGDDGQQNQLYLNDGTGTFSVAIAARIPTYKDGTRAVALGDVDADGDLDMVFGGSGQNRLYLNNGSGKFTDATAARMPAGGGGSVALGDVDGDDDLDIVFGNRLYLNDGTGIYSDATATHMPVGSGGSVALGDVDGDGDLDLVIGNNGQQNRLYLNDGTGIYISATAARMPVDSDNTYAVALGDVDGDVDLDLVFGNYEQQNRLYLNDGMGIYTDATAARMPADNDRTNAVVLGDVDGDSDIDIAFGNGLFPLAQQNRLYLNDGRGQFTDVTAARMPVDNDNTRAVALGDVDGDRDLDMVVGNDHNAQPRKNRLYLNDGTGTYTDATAIRMPTLSDNTDAVALGDVDGDGDLDMVCGNRGQQNRLYLNDGTGTFTDVSATRMPVDNDFTAALVLGDVDGDGDLDMVVGNRLYVNLLRQLDAPLLLRVGCTYTLEAYARYDPSRTSVLPFVSAATASIPLPPAGTIGIDPTRMVALPPFIIPQPAGMGSIDIQVPNIPSIVGGSAYAQALLLPPLRARLTNVTADVIRK